MRIKNGDTVQVTNGKDRGKSGKVIKVLRDQSKVVIEGINLYKKHRRARTQNEKGETITVPRPLSASNVLLYCSNCKRGVRVGVRFDGDKKKRYCKKCQTPV